MQRIKSVTSLVAFASSLAFAAGIHAADNLQLNPGTGTTTENAPRYELTEVTNERVGVSSGGTKTIKFKIHEITAAAGFSLTFPTTSDTPASVEVTYLASGTEYTACDFNTRPYICTLPMNSNITDVSLKISYGNTASSYNYATYSTSYLQACNASTGRYCGSQIAYANKSVTFGPTTEVEVGNTNIFQGNVQLFPVSTGDMAKLSFQSTKSIPASNPPTLRVKGTQDGVEVEIGRRFACKQGNSNQHWHCEVPQYDAIPDVTGYSNVYLSLASSRTGSGAKFTLSNLTQNKNVLSCTAP